MDKTAFCCYKMGLRKMSSSTVHMLSSYLELLSSNYRLRLINVKIKKQHLKSACTGGNLKKYRGFLLKKFVTANYITSKLCCLL